MKKLISLLYYLISLSKFLVKTIGVLFSCYFTMQSFFKISISLATKEPIGIIILVFTAMTFCVLSIIYYILEERIYKFINKIFLAFFIILIISIKTSFFKVLGIIMIINIVVFILSYIECLCRKNFKSDIKC